MKSAYIPPQELYRGGIRLDTNESPYSLQLNVIATAINRYRTSSYDELRQALAAHHHIHEEEIVLGDGSSQLLDASIAAFGSRGVASPDPTYRQYRHLAEHRGVDYVDVPLDETFHVQSESFAPYRDQMKVVSNPNNPTGLYEPVEVIEKIAQGSEGAVIVDEAYIEFAEPEATSAIGLVDDQALYVVIRTFSKAYAAAGLRLAYAVTDKKKSKELQSVLPLYPTGELQHQAGLQLLNQASSMRSEATKLTRNRDVIAAELLKLGCEVLPSTTNFLLIKPPVNTSAQRVHSSLLDHGIVVRSMSDQERVKDWLRVSIGTDEDNQKFIDAMKSILS